MSVILEELDRKFNGKYDYIRVNKVDIDIENGRADIVFLYPYEKEGEFLEKDRECIKKWILYMMPNKLKYNVIFKKSYIDEDVLLAKVKDYFRANLRTIFSQLDENDIEVSLDEKMHVGISIGPRFYDFLVDQQRIESTLKVYLEHNFTRDAEITVTKKDADGEFVFEVGEERVVQFARREIDAREKQQGAIIGKGIYSKPMFISDVKADMPDIVICGKVEQFTRRISKKTEYIYYTFVLDDTTSKISCKYFTRKKTKGILDGMADGTEVLIEGKSVNDTFEKAVSVFVNRLSYATIDYTSIATAEEEDKNILYDHYLTVEPERYIDMKQQNIFTMGEDTVVPYLVGKDFVVFDFETTGLNEHEDKPIELGALRLKNGVKVETFSTLIDPECPIPPKITEITHIDDDMVVGAPTWREVVADFYKFTRGATLVGHNVMFDYNILMSNSKDLGYEFDNALVDTCKLAAENVRGQANNRLITLCNFLGISLEGAHRALNDVLATTDLFIRLAKDYLSE